MLKQLRILNACRKEVVEKNVAGFFLVVICYRLCHITDVEHKHVTCTKPCTKTVCQYGHKCTRMCFQSCDQCLMKVSKTLPNCLHSVMLPCFQDVNEWKCNVPCDKTLACGHQCGGTCYLCVSSQTHADVCFKMVERTLQCGHTVSLECYKDTDNMVCKELCKSKLDCGHLCSGTCGSCFGGKLHNSCSGTCGKLLPCGHKCSFPCTDVCPPCNKPCEWKCSHNVKCKKEVL